MYKTGKGRGEGGNLYSLFQSHIRAYIERRVRGEGSGNFFTGKLVAENKLM